MSPYFRVDKKILVWDNTQMFYTGIGSRSTPKDILELMTDIAMDLACEGYILRSGGADGADSAFEHGAKLVQGRTEIYLPWKKFNGHNSELFNIPDAAYKIAEDIYGTRWKILTPAVRKLMARNICQVTGETLDKPSDFVVCWTPDGCTNKATRNKETGGTGQAIAYADTTSVPVFNLENEDDFERLIKFKETIGVMEW